MKARYLASVQEKKGFHSRKRTIRFRVGIDDLADRLLPARQFKRLVEEVGFPPIIDLTDMAKTPLLRAATWLADSEPNVALGILLRTCRSYRDDALDSFFTQTRIALLSAEDVENLASRVEASLDHAVPAAEKSSVADDLDRFIYYWIDRVQVGVELLARLVLRLDMDRAEKIVERALTYYSQASSRNDLSWMCHWIVFWQGP